MIPFLRCRYAAQVDRVASCFVSDWNAVKASSGSAGRRRFLEGYQRLRRTAAIIAHDDKAFAQHWRDLASFYAETLDYPAVRTTLLRARADGLVSPVDLDMFATIESDAYLKSAALTGRRALSDLFDGSAATVSFDLNISCWAKYLNPADPTRLDARWIWYRAASKAAQLAGSRGETAAITPDYLAPLIRESSARTLSWHTAGLSPGVVHFKPADLPNYTVIDAGGYSGWSTMASVSLGDAIRDISLDEAVAFRNSHRDAILRGNVSKFQQNKITREALGFNYVFVALQVASDRTQRCAYVPMLRMLDMVVDRFAGTSMRVVVKRHPWCQDACVSRRISELSAEGRIIIRDDSIHDLICGCTAVFTVNSGVGSEAMIHGKPIYTFGGCDYAAATHVIKSDDDLRLCTNPIRHACSSDELTKFIFAYRTRYLVDVTDDARLTSAMATRLYNLGSDAVERGSECRGL